MDIEEEYIQKGIRIGFEQGFQQGFRQGLQKSVLLLSKRNYDMNEISYILEVDKKFVADVLNNASGKTEESN